MDTEEMIAVNEFCLHHNIELSFIYALNQSGLIDITLVEETVFVPADQLKHLELFMCLKQDMEINLEGIETIAYLLERIHRQQDQIILLNNKLSFYEA